MCALCALRRLGVTRRSGGTRCRNASCDSRTRRLRAICWSVAKRPGSLSSAQAWRALGLQRNPHVRNADALGVPAPTRSASRRPVEHSLDRSQLGDGPLCREGTKPAAVLRQLRPEAEVDRPPLGDFRCPHRRHDPRGSPRGRVPDGYGGGADDKRRIAAVTPRMSMIPRRDEWVTARLAEQNPLDGILRRPARLHRALPSCPFSTLCRVAASAPNAQSRNPSRVVAGSLQTYRRPPPAIP